MFPPLTWTPLLSGKLLVYGNLHDSIMSVFGALVPSEQQQGFAADAVGLGSTESEPLGVGAQVL